jgi:hypothetical protein
MTWHESSLVDDDNPTRPGIDGSSIGGCSLKARRVEKMLISLLISGGMMPMSASV